MSKSTIALTLAAASLVVFSPVCADAQLLGTVNFVVLHVTFSDFGTGTRFTTAQVQTNFNNIATLWGNQSSYGNINIQYQFGGPYQVASASGTYLDQQGGQFSSNAAILQLIKDAVAGSPNTINWTNVYGVVVLFGDSRAGGFYRGVTWPGTTSINPPAGGTFNVHASIVGEAPLEDVTTTWSLGA